jgi:sulfofructose kinase
VDRFTFFTVTARASQAVVDGRLPLMRSPSVDSTGGDAFHGGYATALLDGLPLPLCMEFAAWVAAQVALKLGGRTNLPTRDSIRKSDLSMLSAELRSHLLRA